MKRYKLLIPGPVEVAEKVLQAMGEPLVAHYGAEWTSFYNKVIEGLQQVFRTQGDVILLVGSGSAGLDAAIGSAVGDGRRILVPQNGFFGERLAEIARSYTPYVKVLPFPWGEPVQPEEVQRHLKRGDVDVVAVVHCETSTGVLNPVEEIGALCKRQGVLLIVDAIASLGIEPLQMDEWGIGICVSASQKGLEAPPGLAPVAVHQEAWDFLSSFRTPGWYLNLRVWKEYQDRWADWHPHPVTQAVNNVKALWVGLQRIQEEGLEKRFERHRRISVRLRSGLEELGLKPVIPKEIASHGVTAVEEPSGRVDELLRLIKEQEGYLLAGSLGAWKGRVFRIGHIGPGATEEAIDSLLKALRRVLDQLKDVKGGD